MDSDRMFHFALLFYIYTIKAVKKPQTRKSIDCQVQTRIKFMLYNIEDFNMERCLNWETSQFNARFTE
jgi:hypothetical protein